MDPTGYWINLSGKDVSTVCSTAPDSTGAVNSFLLEFQVYSMGGNPGLEL